MVPLYFDELAELLRVCTRLRPTECMPSHIHQAMGEHLSHLDSGLARKIMAFNGPQREALSAFIRHAQTLVGMGHAHATVA
jgi:hypothetical protein